MTGLPPSTTTPPEESAVDNRSTLPSQKMQDKPSASSLSNRHDGRIITDALSLPSPDSSWVQWPLRHNGVQPGNMRFGSVDQDQSRHRQEPERNSNPGTISKEADALPYRNDINQAEHEAMAPSDSRRSYDRSLTSSVAKTIPDFPLPGPSPTATGTPNRRTQDSGQSRTILHKSSYHSQKSTVSPIVEECRKPLATPSLPFGLSKLPQSRDPDAESDIEPPSESGKALSNASSNDSHVGLFRLASLGTKSTPALTTIKGSDKAVRPKTADTIQGRSTDHRPRKKQAISHKGTPLPRSTSPSSTLEKPRIFDPIIRSRSPLASPSDRIATQSSTPRLSNFPGTVPAMSDKIATSRRPPRLNIDAVREAEKRGSLTSLPDLIQRATKLASNLDRSTSSRQSGKLDMEEKGDLDFLANERPSSGSISGILASFPPPGSTPTESRPPSRWPTRFSPSGLGQWGSHLTSSSSTTATASTDRRCCGMSLVVFLVVLLVLLVLVAAAVIIPVVEVVLPRHHRAATTSATGNGPSGCSNSLPCLNAGVSVVSGGVCHCVCTNGFTGDQCGSAAGSGCTTMGVANDRAIFTNATLGTSIARLLTGAQTNFSIPLNASQILTVFSASNLSCTVENALVTFNGQSSKSRRFYMVPWSEADRDEGGLPLGDTVARAPVPTPAAHLPSLLARQNAVPDAATSNGIVFQTSGAPSSIMMTVPTASSSAPTATAGPGSGQSTSGLFLTPETRDFGRIAVLFVLERTNALAAAISAQEQIQGYFFGRSTNGTMEMSYNGLNLKIDFGTFSIESANGTMLGGKGDGNGNLAVHRIRKRSLVGWDI